MSQSANIPNILAKLRLSVLASGEKLPDKCWDSSGLNSQGQNDLCMVFPRTSLLAACTHAAELARAHHDERTRASGVFHLFRLPTDTESAIHREFTNSIPNDYSLESELWSELNDLPAVSTTSSEGPVNLDTLDLQSAEDVSRLAYAYKSAFDAGTISIPYFTIAE